MAFLGETSRFTPNLLNLLPTGQTSSGTEMMQSLHWRRLDQPRINNKLFLMYKITHNLIAIPISDFLIPLVRPSRHYHPLAYRLITATTDYYNYSFFPRAVFQWNNLPLETHCGLFHLWAIQPSSLQDWPRLTIGTSLRENTYNLA